MKNLLFILFSYMCFGSLLFLGVSQSLETSTQNDCQHFGIAEACEEVSK